uniref:Uncharacterized protein n=1 Tax=Gossypium raimondii TaxID=29730 RepID=A0A0D2PZR0_GOSRA|nr:hypothetical protein B456_001G165400 [Gossypium raimondii]
MFIATGIMHMDGLLLSNWFHSFFLRSHLCFLLSSLLSFCGLKVFFMLYVATLLVQSFNRNDERVTKPKRPIAFSLASVFKIPLYENEIKPQLFSPFRLFTPSF